MNIHIYSSFCLCVTYGSQRFHEIYTTLILVFHCPQWKAFGWMANKLLHNMRSYSQPKPRDIGRSELSTPIIQWVIHWFLQCGCKIVMWLVPKARIETIRYCFFHIVKYLIHLLLSPPFPYSHHIQIPIVSSFHNFLNLIKSI